MKNRPMIIDEDAKQKIKAVIVHAEANVFSMDDLLDIYNKQEKVAADQSGFVCEIPVGYRIVYSLEDQPAGIVRHLSVSVDEDKCLPNPPTVELLMKLFGFQSDLAFCHVKLEDISPSRQAINVLE